MLIASVGLACGGGGGDGNSEPEDGDGGNTDPLEVNCDVFDEVDTTGATEVATEDALRSALASCGKIRRTAAALERRPESVAEVAAKGPAKAR